MNPDTTTQALLDRIDALQTQVAYLVDRQRKQEELLADMTPILRAALGEATWRLDALEKQGWFAFGRELGAIAERVVGHYSPGDVRQLGDATIAILDTVRALTQPAVLHIAAEAGQVLQNADSVEPVGVFGMMRASGDHDVQKGVAVMLELLRHLGRGAQALAQTQDPAALRKARLAASLGPKRRAAVAGPPGSNTQPAGCAIGPSVPAPTATVVDGVAFSADGHLADPNVWTRELGDKLALALGLQLDPPRWQLVDAARADWGQTGQSPNVRRLTQVTGIATKEIYALFPKAPGRTICKVAGIPKPAGCL
ncbi:MAG: TusE/DsrC/DsvC family sulfur relay protein [Deltaproteobacteria bacterium]|nr:TusE/DsrC/DsvC family sulfur relay protein [Deltaproteobacteria bacterium]